jgi:hypothetical protein
MFVPPPIASFALLRPVDFAYIRDSAPGRYLARYMTPAMVAVRLLGTVPMVVGAWLRVWWLIPLGLAITVFGWLRGAALPRAGMSDVRWPFIAAIACEQPYAGTSAPRTHGCAQEASRASARREVSTWSSATNSSSARR